MNTKADQKTADPLKVLFPEQEVVLPDDSKVVVRPLSLEHLPKVFKHFSVVVSYVVQGFAMQEIGILAMAELMEIIPYCIDRPVNEVPATHVPEVIEIVLEQNVTEESVGKWQSLIEKVLDLQEKGLLGQANPSPKQ